LQKTEEEKEQDWHLVEEKLVRKQYWSDYSPALSYRSLSVIHRFHSVNYPVLPILLVACYFLNFVKYLSYLHLHSLSRYDSIVTVDNMWIHLILMEVDERFLVVVKVVVLPVELLFQSVSQSVFGTP
jgi:hypothetical protein